MEYSHNGAVRRGAAARKRLTEAAAGRQKADLVLKNASYVNVFTDQISTANIAIVGDRIAGIGSYEGERELDMTGKVLLPGLIDGHIHLESSLASPGEFVRAVLPHGTTAVVTDPHEITNVMGTEGIDYMLEATEGLPVDVLFLLPSCVPSTPMDESGAELSWRDIDSFYDHPRVLGLAEMMNYYGVTHGDEGVLSKLAAAQLHGKRMDGHAPGLAGRELDAYIAAGIGSDHECSTLEEALAKLERGQYIMIREGTAARNLAALAPLLTPR
ncbi:MAG: amidohydrolase family protein, partial [Clostridiales bacterium]|nr:amidohydrolase family protein [Clostridiales bacterium]